MLLPPTGRRFGHLFWPATAGFALLWVLIAFVIRHPWVFKLDLGSKQAPTTRFGYFAAFSTLFSLMAAGFLATAIARHVTLRQTQATLARTWNTGRHWPWLLAAVALAVSIPLILRLQLVGPAPLADEEGAYVFMAELLAEGRWVAPPFPDFKHFRQFPLIYAGNWVVPEVLLGWPALLVPGVWLGRPELVAPVVSGLGVIPLYLTGVRLLGPGWGRFAALLYVFSPMITIAAMTRLPHAASLSLLSWMLWFVVRSRDPDPPAWVHLGLAGAFFWVLNIHPGPALALGTPMLLSWLWHQLRRFDGTTIKAVAVLLVVAGLGLFLFRTVNELQTGRAAVPAVAVRFLNSGPQGTWEVWRRIIADTWVVPAWQDGVARLAMAGFRMNLALFGWAMSLLFVPFAVIRGRHWAVLWGMVIAGLALQWVEPKVGFDLFGPARLHELALPLVLLTSAGLKSLTEGLARTPARMHPHLDGSIVPICLAVGLALSAMPAYWFPRLAAVQRTALSTYKPMREFRRAQLTDAIVFGPTHYNPRRCREGPTQLYVTTMPIPKADSDVWWLPKRFHRQQRRMMREYPERSVWLVRWTKNCGFEFSPLDPDADLRAFKTAGDPVEFDELKSKTSNKKSNRRKRRNKPKPPAKRKKTNGKP